MISAISCEDVVDVDVPSEDPRLIINSLVRVDPSVNIVNVEVEVSMGERTRLGSKGQEVSVEDLSRFIRARLTFLIGNSKALLHQRGTEIPREQTLLKLGK